MFNLRRLICSTSFATNKSKSKFLIEKAKFTVGNDVRFISNNGIETYQNVSSRAFSAKSGGFGDSGEGKEDWGKPAAGSFSLGDSDEGKDDWGKPSAGNICGTGSDGWGTGSSWSTGLTKEDFDGVGSAQQTSSAGTPVRSSAIGAEGHSQSQSYPRSKSAPDSGVQEIDEKLRELQEENKKGKSYIDKWGKRMHETCVLLKQVREPGLRGSYLKDSEKAEMYRLHNENPEVYTVERLAKDYRIMRQRVQAVLWLKQNEAEQERKLGQPLDDSINLLLDKFPEFFNSHDREFHVAALPYKPDFKVMPEGWDGTIRDKDEVHYEISKKEDDMLYRDFVLRMNFSKKMMSGEVKGHKYSRRRSSKGWDITVEKLGQKGKRGDGGGWKFVSLPDGSSRPLNEMEKLYVKRETPRRRRKFLHPNATHSSIVK